MNDIAVLMETMDYGPAPEDPETLRHRADRCSGGGLFDGAAGTGRRAPAAPGHHGRIARDGRRRMQKVGVKVGYVFRCLGGQHHGLAETAPRYEAGEAKASASLGPDGGPGGGLGGDPGGSSGGQARREEGGEPEKTADA